MPSPEAGPLGEAEFDDGVRCVVMPCCGFTFDADFTDNGGGYSCPACGELALAALLEAERARADEWQDRARKRSTPALEEERERRKKAEAKARRATVALNRRESEHVATMQRVVSLVLRVQEAEAQLAAERETRDHWIRLFNRLETAARRHVEAKQASGFSDEADDALAAAHRSVMRDAARSALAQEGERDG